MADVEAKNSSTYDPKNVSDLSFSFGPMNIRRLQRNEEILVAEPLAKVPIM